MGVQFTHLAETPICRATWGIKMSEASGSTGDKLKEPVSTSSSLGRTIVVYNSFFNDQHG
jgi:hypothetical protein